MFPAIQRSGSPIFPFCDKTNKALENVKQINKTILSLCSVANPIHSSRPSPQNPSKKISPLIKCSVGAVVGVGLGYIHQNLDRVRSAVDPYLKQGIQILEDCYNQIAPKLANSFDQFSFPQSLPSAETIHYGGTTASTALFSVMTYQNLANLNSKIELGKKADELENNLDSVVLELHAANRDPSEIETIRSLFTKQIEIMRECKKSALGDLAKTGLMGSLTMASLGVHLSHPTPLLAGLGLGAASAALWLANKSTTPISLEEIGKAQLQIANDLQKY